MIKWQTKKVRDNIFSYAFIAPFLLVFFVFLGYPVIYSFILSLHKVSIFSNLYDIFGDMKFVGFKNYAKVLFHDVSFWWSVIITFIYALLIIPTNIFVSLILAVILNKRPYRGRSIFRSAYFLPNVLDMLVVGIIWVLILAPRYGLIDFLLNKIGITYFSNTGFLGNKYFALPVVAFVIVLKGCGFGMILFLAAIQNIPQSFYEEADIDGATEWQKFTKITIPLVKPIILFMVITGIMGALNAFTEIYAMTGGGPSMTVGNTPVGATRTSGYYLFQAFQRGRYGYAAAISFILLIIGLIISFINFKLIQKK